jgi:peroxiredoxin
MALTYTQPPTEKQLGSPAPDFRLPGVDGRVYDLASFPDARALVVVFMCNHCPYVIAVQERINELAKEYAPRGVRVIGINPNDPVKYPDDSMEAMKQRAQEQGYVFPYLQDISQETARAYGAVCTPDPFVFERAGSQFLLRYHGRIDDSWKDPAKVTHRELARALDAVLSGHPVDGAQNPAMGCSIKWRS